MANVKALKKGERFWCWWMSRYLFFRMSYVKCFTGVTCYVFEDIADARFELTEEQVGKLERRA